MKTIRQNVFETNSSSSHSVTIQTSPNKHQVTLNDEGVLFVERGEFGWDNTTFVSFDDKCSYAYTQAANNHWCNRDKNPSEYLDISDNEKLQMMERVIMENVPNITKVLFLNNEGYVDHQSEDLVYDIFESEDTLTTFLFDTASEFSTGNDNEW